LSPRTPALNIDPAVTTATAGAEQRGWRGCPNRSAMSSDPLRIVLHFSADDQIWMRQNKVAVPKFWSGHSVPPAQGDVLRISGRQFLVQARVWEHDGEMPLLRLFLGNAHAQSDTIFG
jgi:hypothetical protein